MPDFCQFLHAGIFRTIVKVAHNDDIGGRIGSTDGIGEL